MIGQTISHYKILEKLGEGGMGVVYKAQDTKLDRVVALKFLPPQVSSSPVDKARFVQEAKTAASLNHPNICTIYGIEDVGDTAHIAMEFIQGRTLKERIDESPLKVKEAIDIAIKLALGLAAAHEKGIIHRDLKSANVMITEQADVKIMDFGLAKTAKASVLLTQQGTTVGTIAYMSPEQARGDKLDRRTDIWSLGVILYEMVTGQLPFKGEFEQAMVYSLLNQEPEPVTGLRSGIPLELERVIAKALEKDPANRYQHADELAVDLKAIRSAIPSSSKVLKTTTISAASDVPGTHHPVAAWIWASVIGGALVLGGVASWTLKPNPSPPSQQVTRFVLPFETNGAADGILGAALSPDGARLVYKLRSNSTTRLYLREMNKLEPKPLLEMTSVGTYASLFFSPDGRWVSFVEQGKLKKLSLSGGEPIVICDMPETADAEWIEGGSIVFHRDWGSHLWIVSSEANSTPRPLTTVRAVDGERGHLHPRALPGGGHALFTIWTGAAFEQSLIGLVDIATGQHSVILRGGADARYVSSGHLVYSRGATLMAVPFDLGSLNVKGEAYPVLDSVSFAGGAGFSYLSVAGNGTIAYVQGGVNFLPTLVALFEGGRKVKDIRMEGKDFGDPLFAPDGRRLVLTLYGYTYHQAILDLQRNSLTQLTFAGDNYLAAWKKDGSKLSYTSNLGGTYQIYQIAVDGSGTPEKLFDQEGTPFPGSWSPDGKMLAYVVAGKETKADIWLFSPEGNPKQRPLIQGPAIENSPAISPDGRWMAYVSDETGQAEIYVKPFPDGTGKWRISDGSGRSPVWAPDGKKIYYSKDDQIMSVSVSVLNKGNGKALDVGREEHFMRLPGLRSFDLSPNGKTFVVAQQGTGSYANKLHIVLNWSEELKAKVPIK